MSGNVRRGFEYGYGAAFGRAAAAGTMALGAAAVNAHLNRPISHWQYRKAGGERLALMTVTQGGFTTGCYLYRVVGKGKLEPLGGWDSDIYGLPALEEWVRYLNDGGTVAEWRAHNQAQAWIAWHQDRRRRIMKHSAEVSRWLKDHPKGGSTPTTVRARRCAIGSGARKWRQRRLRSCVSTPARALRPSRRHRAGWCHDHATMHGAVIGVRFGRKAGRALGRAEIQQAAWAVYQRQRAWAEYYDRQRREGQA